MIDNNITTETEQHEQQKRNMNTASETLTIPTDMANMIINDIDPNAFVLWKQSGCVVEPVINSKSMRLMLNGDTSENESLLVRIFPVLEQAHDVLQKNTGRRYILMLGILIPERKCGYIIGKERRTITKVQNDFQVQVITDNGKREPIPDGFVRLLVRTDDVPSLRGARSEIRRLEARSLDFNPGLTFGIKTLESRTLRESIKIPAWWQFNKVQKIHFLEIQKSSAIDWTFDADESSHSRFVTLEGDTDRVLAAKKRLAKLITEIEEDERRGSSIRLSTSPTNGINEYSAVIKVPTPTWQRVIGVSGRTIKGLRDRFTVGMGFLGDNFVVYPEFRYLRIKGQTEDSVMRAKEYIEREYVQKSVPEPYAPTNSVSLIEAGGYNKDTHTVSIDECDSSKSDQKQHVAIAMKAAISGGWGSDDESWGDAETRVSSDFEGDKFNSNEVIKSNIEGKNGKEENANKDKSSFLESKEDSISTCDVDEEEKQANNSVLGRGEEAVNEKEKRIKNEMIGTDQETDEYLLIIENKCRGEECGSRKVNDEKVNETNQCLADGHRSDGIGTGDEYGSTSSITEDCEGRQRFQLLELLSHADMTLQRFNTESTALLDRAREALFDLTQQLSKTRASLHAREQELNATKQKLQEKERECEQLRLVTKLHYG